MDEQTIADRVRVLAPTLNDSDWDDVVRRVEPSNAQPPRKRRRALARLTGGRPRRALVIAVGLLVLAGTGAAIAERLLAGTIGDPNRGGSVVSVSDQGLVIFNALRGQQTYLVTPATLIVQQGTTANLEVGLCANTYGVKRSATSINSAPVVSVSEPVGGSCAAAPSALSEGSVGSTTAIVIGRITAVNGLTLNVSTSVGAWTAVLPSAPEVAVISPFAPSAISVGGCAYAATDGASPTALTVTLAPPVTGGCAFGDVPPYFPTANSVSSSSEPAAAKPLVSTASGTVVSVKGQHVLIKSAFGSTPVWLTTSTVVTRLQSGRLADLRPGLCMRAEGFEARPGVLTANPGDSVSVEPPGTGGCLPTFASPSGITQVVGAIKQVHGERVVVTATPPPGPGGVAYPSTTTVVVFRPTTSIDETATVTPAAIKVGGCIAATGVYHGNPYRLQTTSVNILLPKACNRTR